RRDTEEARFGIDGPKPAVRSDAHPRDVVAYGPDLPALAGRRRHQHGEVGLAARARKGGRDVVRLTLGIREPQNQHVLGEPALFARLHAGDAQREALLAEQRVAAIPGADRPDGLLLREVRDVAALRREVAER